MSQFNHKFKNVADAVGISDTRRIELGAICEQSHKDASCISETMENILSHGLNVIETMYCGYLVGKLDEKLCNQGLEKMQMIRASSPEDLMNKLKDLLRGQIEDQDE